MNRSHFSVYLTIVALVAAIAVVAIVEIRGAQHSNTTPTDESPHAAAQLPNAASAGAPIDVVFVVDATGSMGGLIDGARRTVFDIAAQTAAQNPQSTIRFGLVAYRDRQDSWTTQVHPLTEDIDAIYASLRELRAHGGGDTPEAVNDGLLAALERNPWSSHPEARRSIFLIGDAPPQTQYDDDVPWQESIASARQRDIYVHAIQCGHNRQTEHAWRAIAQAGAGVYQQLAQDGNVGAHATAVDDDLAGIGRRMGATHVPYGAAGERDAQRRSLELGRSLSAPEAAARVTHQARTGRFGGGGSGDLVDRYGSGALAFEDIDRRLLPSTLQGMSDSALREHLDTQVAERRALADEAEALIEARDEELAPEEGGGAPSLHRTLGEVISGGR